MRQWLAEFAGGAHRAQQGATKGWRRATRVANQAPAVACCVKFLEQRRSDILDVNAGVRSEIDMESVVNTRIGMGRGERHSKEAKSLALMGELS